MATHDDPERDRWVDNGMASLEPDADDQPDVTSHLAEVRAHGPRTGRPSTGTWLVAAGVVVWITVMVFSVGPFSSSSDEPPRATAGPLDQTGAEGVRPSVATTTDVPNAPPRRSDEPDRRARPGSRIFTTGSRR